jgi:hypothetical protein
MNPAEIRDGVLGRENITGQFMKADLAALDF